MEVSGVEQVQGTIACYIRLSREDGDRAESLSVENQRLLLSDYCGRLAENPEILYFVDDGYSGTSYDRPDFIRMKECIEQGGIQCVVVKDLSRLGRESGETNYYVQKYFPQKRVRFIAVDDGIDRLFYDADTFADMNIEIKNMFNGFYPKDISRKVRATVQVKQKKGLFIGAFACYGYRKDPQNHNHLLIDEPAAAVVRRIFDLYLQGVGQNTIARQLNEEGVPCPTEYKRQCGMKYCNSKQMEGTTYWTYSTVHKILQRQQYTGAVVQNQSFRGICGKKAVSLPKSQWIVVPDSHEAIIDKNTFDKVQKLFDNHARPALEEHIHMFAGCLKCGDCGRSLVRLKRKGKAVFNCGSYNRYGKSICSAHMVEEDVLAELVRNDFNAILEAVGKLRGLIEQEQNRAGEKTGTGREMEQLLSTKQRLEAKKEKVYNDYLEEVISRQEYLKYRDRLETQIGELENRLGGLCDSAGAGEAGNEWIDRLMEIGHVEKLDRQTVVELVDCIYIYDDDRILIVYNFANDLGELL